MTTHAHNMKRDTLGRVVTSHQSSELNNAHISGDRESIRASVAHRFDARKGAELLNSRNMGRREGPWEAPLDHMRTRRGDGIKVAADLFPLEGLPPEHRATLIELCKSPAMARAYTVNPDATIKIVGEKHPELRPILEANAPFSLKDGLFSVNTNSAMFGVVNSAERLGVSPSATRLHKGLDRLHTSMRGTALGGAAGIETSSVTFLTACARHGFHSTQAVYAAVRLQTMMHTDRAQEDLKIVASLISHHTVAPQSATLPISRQVPTPPAPEPHAPPQLRSAPEVTSQPQPPPAIISPRPISPENVTQSAPTPADSPAPQDIVAAPVSPPSIVDTTPMPQSSPTPTPASTAPASAEVAREVAPITKAPELAVTPNITITPTMQRLVDVVNNSTLDRQIGSPRNNPILEFSDKDHDMLKKMLTDPATKHELLSYSDEQIKKAFEAVRPDRITYLEQWLAMNHRDAVKHPKLALSMAGITPQDTNRIGQVVGIARSVAQSQSQ